MNAYELAEIADGLCNEIPIREWIDNEPKNIMTDIAVMLRQQAEQIADLQTTVSFLEEECKALRGQANEAA